MRIYLGDPDTTSPFIIKVDGTYTLSNGVVKTIINNPIYPSTSATVNGNFNYMQGTWGFAPSNNNGGIIKLTKQ